MQITKFLISPDRKQIDVTIIDAATITALNFWVDSTYKDYSKTIDLTAKLTASATENITLTLADLGLGFFDGIFFLEAQDPNEISEAVEKDLTRFKECILNKLVIYSVCDSCLQEQSIPLLNAHALLTGLEDAVEQAFINEIILINNALKLYCSNECISCGDKSNVINTNYYAT